MGIILATIYALCSTLNHTVAFIILYRLHESIRSDRGRLGNDILKGTRANAQLEN